MKKKAWIAIITGCVLSLLFLSTEVLAGGKTWEQLVQEAAAKIKEISVTQVSEDLLKGKTYIFIDTRTKEEYDAGHIAKSVLIDRGVLEFEIGKSFADQNADIIVYCRSGKRGTLATMTLQEMGYTNAKSLIGGFKSWVEAGNTVYNMHGELLVKTYGKQE
jgi:rhodanese-related sulfurtransferase